MVNCEIFTTNFKLLRLSHFLSMSDLALILNFKNKSTIAQLETGKIFPSFETLLEIANLFAINIDWLVGRSSKPYSEEIILQLESEIMSIKLNANTEFRQSIPDIYSNIDKRIKFYSLSERANLIFLLQYLKILTEKKSALLHNDTTLNFFKHILKQTNIKKQRFKDAEEKYLYVLRSIAAILLNDLRQPLDANHNLPFQIPKPLFDISKLPENF